MTQEEEVEFDRLKTARNSLLLTVANLRGQLETIAAAEREACAELRNMLHGFDGKGRQEMVDAMNRGLDEYQALIRARGEQA